jgi:hypothetical protein
MASRLPRLIPAFAALALATAGAATAQLGPAIPGVGRDVVTRAMIEEAGLLRLGELVRLAPQWSAATVDDFTWRALPRSQLPGADDAWTLLVDGRPVATGGLGIVSLERLPIDLASVDSIVFVSSPALEGGVYATAGLIHLHTRRPDPGVSARGRVGFGSETGDPGPFAFLPDGRQNRDRYGHESAVEGAVARGGWYAAGSYSASVHLPTDPLILPRMYAASVHTPRIERIAPGLRLGVDGAAGGHHLLAGGSRIDDWMRLDAVGVEVPVRSTLTHVSAAGGVRASRFEVGYRAGIERSRIASVPRTTAPPLDFEWRTIRGTVEVRASAPEGRRVGLSIVRHSGHRHAAQPLGRDTEIGAFGELTLRSTAGVRHHVAASVSSRGHGAEGGANFSSSFAVPRGAVTLRVSASRTRAVSAMGLLELAGQGEPWFEEVGAAFELPPIDAMARAAAVELGWATRAGRRTNLSSSAFLRAFDGAVILRRDLAWDPVYRAWRGPVIAGAASGRLGGGHLSLRHRATATLDAAADVHLVWAFGDSAFRRGAEPVPSLRSVVSATWRPVTGFGLRGELEIESARRWPDYDAAEPGAGKARAVQPAGGVVSLSAWKTFLDGRIRGQLAARNLTGRRIILHPEGRASALAFLFLLGASF